MKKIISFLLMILLVNVFVFNVKANEIEGENNDVLCLETLLEDLNISQSDLIVDDGTSLNTLEVRNDDGTNTIYIFDKDIKYLDNNGNVVNKDLSIVSSTEKEKIKNGYIATVKANNINTCYPATLNNKGIILDNIQLVPISSSAILTESNSYEVFYDNLFEGVDLVCMSQLEGFLGKLNLESINNFNKIRFMISSSFPYNIYCEDDCIMIEIDGNDKYRLLGSSILDNNGNYLGESCFVLEEDNSISMSYSLAEEVSLTEAVTTSLLMENVSIQKSAITEVNVFSDTISGIEEGYNYIGTNEDGTIARTFVKFDLSALEGIDYDRILSAYYNTYLYEFNTGDISEIYFVRESCNYGNLEWSNMPETGKKIFGQTNSVYSLEEYTGNEKSYYITNAVQAWLQGMSNNGIMIKARNDEGWCKMSNAGNSCTYLSVTYSEYQDTPITKGVLTGNRYYFINKHSKKALHTASVSSSSNIIQKTYNMSDNQKWQILYYTNVDGTEYYLIRSNSSAYYLNSNMSLTLDSELYSDNSVASDNILWKIVRNWDGSYKIISKDHSPEKALNVTNGSMSDNASLSLESPTVDFIQSDDWTLIPVDRDDACVYGSLKEATYLISSKEVKKVANNLINKSYNCKIFIDETAELYLDELFSSQICYFSSHGRSSRIDFYSDNDLSVTENTSIGLVNGIDSSVNDSDVFNVYGIKDYEGNMNRLQFSFMNSCSTGSNNGNESLLGAMYEEGAHSIIAFTRNLEYSASQEWQGFFNLMLNKSDIESAELFADRMMLSNGIGFSNTNARHVLGDTTIFYNYEDIAKGEEITVGLANLLTSTATSGTTDSSLEQYAYVPLSDEYYTVLDEDGNIYGYDNNTDELVFYSINRRNYCFAGDYLMMAGAMNCCIAFLNDIGYSTNEYLLDAYSNEYSNEFIVEFKNSSETVVGEVEKIVVYVELDSTNNYHVTFFNAIRK